MAARYHARFESLPTLYLKGSEYMLKVSIPDSKAKIEQTIEALESLLPYDDEKSKKYHMEAIEELRAALKKYDD
jgi:hypothetical protein